MKANISDISHQIKAEALRLGFSACGIAKAETVDEDVARRFDQWIRDGLNADMHYMTNHRDLRLDPRLLHPGTQSVICVALNYYPERLLPETGYQFALYSYGKDYHDVMRSMLRQLANTIATYYEDETVSTRVCCDTAPILDRYWAWRSGIGWIGRNTNLIIPHAGSFFFIGEILIDRPLVYDTPMTSHCGTCHRCLEACPTGALSDGVLDARLCLSYLTIENRGEIPSETSESLGNCIYGCDRCQLACPHNKFATPTTIEDFSPSDSLLSMTQDDWTNLTPDDYRRLFKGSAVKRAKYEGLVRNIKAVKK